MTQNYRPNPLLESKINDYRMASTKMPADVNVINKVFAKTLGASSGKTLQGYEVMLKGIEAGADVEEIKSQVRNKVSRESKINVDLPFGMNSGARICGLVALNYAGFFDAEVDIYNHLSQDLPREASAYIEPLNEKVKRIGQKNPEVYEGLLAQKEQAIEDFGILMGLTKNKERFEELKSDMSSHMADYFTKIVKLHEGGVLRPSWPLPIKKYSNSMITGLKYDAVSHALEEGIGRESFFINPQESQPAYETIKQNLKELGDFVFSKTKEGKKPSLRTKWQTAKVLPTAAFFALGLDAYAGNGTYTESELWGASTSASVMTCLSDSAVMASNDNSEGLPGSVALVSFITFFTTTLTG